MSSGDLPAIIGGIALVIGTVFTGIAGLDARRNRRDADAAEDYANLQRWYPRVLRAVVLLRGAIARHRDLTEPDGIDDLLAFPPPKPKHSREVTGDAE